MEKYCQAEASHLILEKRMKNTHYFSTLYPEM